MKLTRFKLRDKVYLFPFNWTVDQVVNFANQDFRMCNYCGKIDVKLNHFNNCIGSARLAEQDNIWK